MYNKVRITVAALVVMALCTLSSAMTLSYFTDTKSKENEFTVGNASGTFIVYDDVSNADSANWRELSANNYPPIEDTSEIPLFPQAKNTGNIPVYQRFRIVIPKALANVITLNLPSSMNDCKVETAAEKTCSDDNYIVKYNPSVADTYAEYYLTSKTPLDLNGTTATWPTESIKIGDLSGVDKSLFTCESGANSCTLGIRVYSDTIQTTGFMNAEDAFINLAETY
ncbi:SipW-dependent-type signal peptide-containing protein [Candidatus Saccharibacteria bacterium]|nr:SipW-dependent-type signal peptide-containing protein [Candidatus Saccharibacteria bacterium]MBR6122994.1 SipW-dependent-type signal peptide-containing protein [Candidatus Saccharibacteria bacterium]